jgi:hypothetical protein
MKVKKAPHQIVIRASIAVFVALVLLLIISLSVAAAGGRTLSGRWHRLNPGSPPEHEVMNCGGDQIWVCRYDKQPEPLLGYIHPPDATFGRFKGHEITSSWECPGWFPEEIRSNATFVVEGEMDFHLYDGGNLHVNEQLIVTESSNSQVLYVYWVDQFVCPWYRNFDAALAANPENNYDCTNSP